MDREALVLPVAQGMAHDEHSNLGWNSLLEAEQKRWLSRARAALAIAEPVVREDVWSGLGSVANTFADMSKCPDWTPATRRGYRLAAELIAGHIDAIRARAPQKETE